VTTLRMIDGADRAGPRVGVAFTPFETRSEVIAHVARQADRVGLDRVDLAEGWTHDATILLAELAMRTSHIGLGTSVISAWGRTPATIAMSAAALQSLSGGRFTLGVGASSPPLVEGFHGIEWARPVARLRRTLTAVRALLNGERLPYAPAGARPLRLGVVPEVPVPIMLAALSPSSIRLAGELADGWTPFLWARSRLEEGRALLHVGESRAELPTPTRISVGVPVALGPDEQSARQLAAWWLSTYLTKMGPLYPEMLARRFGMVSGVEAIIGSLRSGKASELPVASEELAREVTLIGTYDRAAEAISAWFTAGADTVTLVLPPGRPEQELAEIVDVAARLASVDAPALARPAA
jgi:alkanesulfonate monooxygenase SsuD/methylene tetrahydromethanopterin reductase-like flavin-dependent oxidoreductase (luciferase family)